MEEIWIETGNKARDGKTIIKVSNTGWIWRQNGRKEESTYAQMVRINGKMTFIHRFLAEHFIQKTDEDRALGRNNIDHITHYPIGININDIRNLRWSTQKENCNFDECKDNKRKNKNKLNKPTSEFGKKYFEYFGYSKSENPKQYQREGSYYYYHGKCSWE